MFLCGLFLMDEGVDPEQEGSYYLFRGDEAFRLFWFTLFLLPILVHFSDLKWVFVFLLSPAFACMFFELGSEKFRGPRVWLSRWYLSTLAIPLLLSGVLFSWWISELLGWVLIGCWAIMSFQKSKLFSSEFLFYKSVKDSNPNPDHFRIHALPFLYLRDGQISQAEDEYLRVLEVDPDNEHANFFVAQMRGNLAWHEKGLFMMGFTCVWCEYQDNICIQDGVRLTRAQHDMFFLRVCPTCLKSSPIGFVHGV